MTAGNAQQRDWIMSSVEIRNLRKSFGPTEVLHGVSTIPTVRLWRWSPFWLWEIHHPKVAGRAGRGVRW